MRRVFISRHLETGVPTWTSRLVSAVQVFLCLSVPSMSPLLRTIFHQPGHPFPDPFFSFLLESPKRSAEENTYHTTPGPHCLRLTIQLVPIPLDIIHPIIHYHRIPPQRPLHCRVRRCPRILLRPCFAVCFTGDVEGLVRDMVHGEARVLRMSGVGNAGGEVGG